MWSTLSGGACDSGDAAGRQLLQRDSARDGTACRATTADDHDCTGTSATQTNASTNAGLDIVDLSGEVAYLPKLEAIPQRGASHFLT